MKLSDIYKNPAYTVADQKAKFWVSDYINKDNTSIIDAAELSGMDLSHPTVDVLLNTGETVTIDVDLTDRFKNRSLFFAHPDAKYKHIYVYDDGGFRKEAYMYKGTNPKGKKSSYFLKSEFEKGKAELADKIQKWADKDITKKYDTLLKKLKDNISDNFLLANKEIMSIIRNNSKVDAEKKIFDWFKSHDYNSVITDPSNFDKFIDKAKADNMIPFTFDTEEGHADGYGHMTGRAADINFDEKKIYVNAWSTDD